MYLYISVLTGPITRITSYAAGYCQQRLNCYTVLSQQKRPYTYDVYDTCPVHIQTNAKPITSTLSIAWMCMICKTCNNSPSARERLQCLTFLTQTQEQYSWVTAEGPGLKITAYYFVCTVARLPGSPEVAVIDLSNPSFQRLIRSPLLVFGVCQRDQAAAWKILAIMSKVMSGQKSASVMNTATLPTSSQVLISQMSTSTAHNNEYLIHLSLFKALHCPYRFKGLAWVMMCVVFHYCGPPQRGSQLTGLRPYLKMFFFLFALTGSLNRSKRAT